ncbi:MAG: hypothetical protein Q9163_002608 [Psora crenata]
MATTKNRPWQEIAEEAQGYRDASIKRVQPAVPNVPESLPLDVTKIPKDLLSEQELCITQTPPEVLLKELALGQLLCVDVTTAFLRRAGLAQGLVNCLTELLPERAIDRAKQLDEYLAQHHKPVGPLHGLPISVKEHVGMKGLGLNTGIISWWNHKAEGDAHVLKILWDAGCVFYARTMQPQTLMHLETSNNFYGETVNPYNRKLTAGGSSGGEGALLALRGSCLGLGTDIGGSIRSPAANCGIYGFRPTSHRIPTEGWAPNMMGQEQIIAVLGPLSTSLEGIKLFMQTVLHAKPWLKEPSLVPIPWRYDHSHLPDGDLKVAVMWHDGVVQPHPPVTRALHQVTAQLKKMTGVRVVDWKPHKHDEAWEIISTLYYPDGAKSLIEDVEASGEPWRPLSTFMLKENPHVKVLSIKEIWHWTGRREYYRSEYAKLWNETVSDDGRMVDVILCPVGPGAAPMLNHAKYWGYTSQWNLLDYPALVFPVTKADPEVDVKVKAFQPISQPDDDNYRTYQDPEVYRGAPVSLQLVGRRYEDEKVSIHASKTTISMVAAVASTKRKKAADMADSPPKRVTRARAAKAPDDAQVKNPTTTKITTASAKIAANKKKAPATSTTKNRKHNTRTDDQLEVAVVDEPTQETQDADQPTMEPTKATRTRQKKAVTAEGPNDPGLDKVPKSKSRQAKTPPAAEKPKPDTLKARGRRKRAATPEAEQADAEPIAAERQPVPVSVKKTTRGRAAAATTARSATTATSAKTTGAKKRVKFEDDQDKENIPMVTPGPKKPATKARGMKAKPVRKPAASRTAIYDKEAAPEMKESKAETLPLSPKKVNQIARTPSRSSDRDELSGEKTPTRRASSSPVKSQPSQIRNENSVSNENGRTNALSSPPKQVSSSVLASPARRPPPSPYKGSMMASPKKLYFGESITRPSFSSTLGPSPTKMSLLQESPRKGKPGDSTLHPLLQPSQTPFKSSLLQSPARRPATSPFKPAVTTSLGESFAASLQISPRKAALFSSLDAVSSPLRAAGPPNRLMRVHKNEDNEPEVDRVEMDASVALDPSLRKDETEASASLMADNVINGADDSNLGSIHKPQDGGYGSVGPSVIDTGPAAPLSAIASMTLRRISTDTQLSEDELASPDKKYAPTPLRRQWSFAHEIATPTDASNDVSMTPLVGQLSGWVASSHDKQRPSRQQRGMFSLGALPQQDEPDQMEIERKVETPAQSSFFDDEMAVIDIKEHTPMSEMTSCGVEDVNELQASMESQASQEYGDENAVPTETAGLSVGQYVNDTTLTCTPAKIFTPIRQARGLLREICTVSKVPLRPSAEDISMKMPRQRSKSFGAPPTLLDQESIMEFSANVQGNDEEDTEVTGQAATPMLDPILVSQTLRSGMRLNSATSGRSGHESAVSNVLKGAVVHVDVHTTEGADASSIFVDLLTQMGARCVKQWNWNPGASLSDLPDSVASPAGTSPNSTSLVGKVGITHVVYKDGGKRTLEKIRASEGVVLCVGVGWVLDCEREGRWLDETEYAVDTSLVPRGGHRRRKSMEPRALANLDGNLVPAGIETPARAMNISPTKEFLTFNTPASRRDTFVLDPQPVTHAEADELSRHAAEGPATPLPARADDDMFEDGSDWGSPTTPYYLSKGAELIQRTCPPKQRAGGLFPVTGNGADEPDQTMRHRLLAARRKSMQWASKTRSPLGTMVSYGK